MEPTEKHREAALALVGKLGKLVGESLNRDGIAVGNALNEFEDRVARALAAEYEAGLERAAQWLDGVGKHYPTDIFPEPPHGQHGDTVDACSAAMGRVASKAWAAAIRRLKGGEGEG